MTEISDGEFIVRYIAESAKTGKTAIDLAKEEINSIDAKLHEAELLKFRRLKLIAVLNHLGDESYKRRRTLKNIDNTISNEVDLKEDEELYLKIQNTVKESGPLNMRELILAVGSYDKDSQIIRAVKQLGEKGVLSRDEEKRICLTN